MKILSNEKAIQRNSKIGQYASLAGLIVLGGGFILSLRAMGLFGGEPQNLEDMSSFTWMWGALLVGFVLSQVGMYFTNRWGRRPDKQLETALKGLDDRYALYHYQTPVPHVLVGPAGVWILEIFHQTGKITYEKNRWRQRGGGILQAYLRFLGPEALGRPDLDVSNDIESLTKFFKKKLPDVELPDIQAALVFLNEKAEISAEDAPHPALLLKELKDYLRKTTKGKALTNDQFKQIQAVIESN